MQTDLNSLFRIAEQAGTALLLHRYASPARNSSRGSVFLSFLCLFCCVAWGKEGLAD